VIRETNVENVDSQRWQVEACTHGVERAAGVVSGAVDVLSEAVARQQLVQLDSTRLRCTFQPDTNIAGYDDRIGRCRLLVQQVAEFKREVSSDGRHARTVDDDEAGQYAGGNMSSDAFKRRRPKADVDGLEAHSGDSDNGDATVVDMQR